ncbi:hypothetical protein PG993_005783 [Apiospora rasikravindrae]|uniref:Aminoglycoside phosphotransferase domain-containing protein n=1 Tax=Apiospora rasikravindrae TaxID=990691 RepID=A0ABR1TCD9_9PEZI
MATENTTKILAVKEVSGYGYFIRAKVDGLIRYFDVNYNAASRFPLYWNILGFSDPLLQPGPYPADVKCIRLRRPDERDNLDSKAVTDYPIAEYLDYKLTGVGNPRVLPTFDYDGFIQLHKIPSPVSCTGSVRTDYPSYGRATSMVMKLAEFPDGWPVQIASITAPASTLRDLPPSFMLNMASAHMVAFNTVPAELGMGREIEMHQKIDAALGAGNGLVPAFYGLVTERGRGIVGFLSEYIEDSRSLNSVFREAADREGPDWVLDEAGREACRNALRRLHRAGFLHGDVHSGNFLRRSGGPVVLIDLEFARRLSPGVVLEGANVDPQVENEMRRLEDWLTKPASSFQTPPITQQPPEP